MYWRVENTSFTLQPGMCHIWDATASLSIPPLGFFDGIITHLIAVPDRALGNHGILMK
jgi:hypothetical protein